MRHGRLIVLAGLTSLLLGCGKPSPATMEIEIWDPDVRAVAKKIHRIEEQIDEIIILLREQATHDTPHGVRRKTVPYSAPYYEKSKEIE